MIYSNFLIPATKYGVIFMIFNFLFISLSCNESSSNRLQNVNSDKAFNIYARYMVKQQDWKVEAKLFPKDTSKSRKATTIDGTIYFQDKKMHLKEIEGFEPKYTFIGNAACDTKIVVSLAPKDKKEATVELSMSPIGKYQIEGKLSKSNGFFLSWEGGPLTKDETLVLLLKDGKGQTHSMNRLGPSKTNSIKVIPPQLKKLNPGKGTLEIIKKGRKNYIDNTKPTGSFAAEYYLDPINILVEE